MSSPRDFPSWFKVYMKVVKHEVLYNGMVRVWFLVDNQALVSCDMTPEHAAEFPVGKEGWIPPNE